MMVTRVMHERIVLCSLIIKGKCSGGYHEHLIGGLPYPFEGCCVTVAVCYIVHIRDVTHTHTMLTQPPGWMMVVV